MNTDKIVAYKFLVKTGGDWKVVRNKERIPILINTDRGINIAMRKFIGTYPGFAHMYVIGETLTAEPDIEATEKLKIENQKGKIEDDKRISGMWWND